MADDFFSPLLADVHGLFGAGHAPTEEVAPPMELEEAASPVELAELMRLEPVTRALAIQFLKSARRNGHAIVLLPALHGLGEYLRPASENMDGTALSQLGDLAKGLKTALHIKKEHLAGELAPPETEKLEYFRVAYAEKGLTIPKKDVPQERWQELAIIGRRSGLKPGIDSKFPDVTLFRHRRQASDEKVKG